MKVKLFLSHIPMWIEGSIVFASPEGAVFDLAVIQLKNKYRVLRLPQWKIASVSEGI